MKAKAYWIHSLTPLHVGAGRGVGFIDLPIMREKSTNWPVLPGSGVKGVLRDHFEQHQQLKGQVPIAFGEAESEDGGGQAGSLVFTDARLVALPVRSLYGTFAYVSSPLALQRLKRDLEDAGQTGIPEVTASIKEPLLPQNSDLLKDQQIWLEELNYTAKSDVLAESWAEFIGNTLFDGEWKNIFKKRFVILPDNDFAYLCETATEVNARIRIEDDTKTVAKGQLWYEESLPAETILAGIVWCDRPLKGGNSEQLLKDFCSETLSCQMGGKATTGKGRVHCHFSQGGTR